VADRVAICGPAAVGAVTCHDAVKDDSAAKAEAVAAPAAVTFQPDGAPLRVSPTLLNDPGPLSLSVAATVAEVPGARTRPLVGLRVNDVCWSAPGRAGNGSAAAAVCAARLAAVVAGVNWVLAGAAFTLPGFRAPVKLLMVARRQRPTFGKVTGPLPDSPPAAATASMSCRQEVWSETWEKTWPPVVQGEMTKHGTRKPAPIGRPPPGVPAADASADSPGPPAHAYLVTGFVLAGAAVALPLVAGLGWRFSLLLAAMCYPSAVGVTFIHTSWIGSVVPTKWVLGLPPLLVACWGAAWTVRRATTRRGGAPGSAG
jgi:hypothetical protein